MASPKSQTIETLKQASAAASTGSAREAATRATLSIVQEIADLHSTVPDARTREILRLAPSAPNEIGLTVQLASAVAHEIAALSADPPWMMSTGSYLDLSDTTDASYVGKAGYFTQVNVGATGLTLFNLFGTTNEFTVGQIINQFVDLDSGGSAGIERITSGQLGVRANNIIKFETSGSYKWESTNDGGGNAQLNFYHDTGPDSRFDFGLDGTIRFQPEAGTTLLTLAPSAATVSGSLTVGTLTGFIKGTTGLLSAVSSIDLSTDITGTLGVTHGGTGLTSCVRGDLFVGTATNVISTLPIDTNATRYLSNKGSGSDPAWSQVSLNNGVTGTLSTLNGGTGLSSGIVKGVLLVGLTTNTFVLKSVGSDNTVLTADAAATGGIKWSLLSLSASVTGTLPIGNGGTGQTTATAAFDALSPLTTKGDIIVFNGTDAVRLPVGADDEVLTADSGEATGLKWAGIPGGVSTYLALTDTTDVSYAGLAGFFPQVNVGETALTLFDLFNTANTWGADQSFTSFNGVYFRNGFTAIFSPSSNVLQLGVSGSGTGRFEFVQIATVIADLTSDTGGSVTLNLYGTKDWYFRIHHTTGDLHLNRQNGGGTPTDVMIWGETSVVFNNPTTPTVLDFSTAALLDLTGSFALSGTLTVGSLAGLLYATAGVVSDIADGSDGEVLTMVSGAPAWAAPGGSGSVSDFIDLGDVPSAYTGAADYFVKVTGAEDGLEFYDLFGSNNHFTGSNTFDNEILITDANSSVSRSGAGVLAVQGSNRVDVLRGVSTVVSFGNNTMTLTDPVSTDHVIDFATANQILIKPRNTTIITLTNAGTTFAGTTTVGTLDGLIYGTTGVLSAIADGTDTHVLTMVAGAPAWAAPTGGLSNAYDEITDGTTTAAASGGDTFKLRSANSILTVAVTSNDVTHGDNALFTVTQGNIDHGSIGGLGDDDHAQYALLAGRSGGQILRGGLDAGDDLELRSTANATKGTIYLGTSGPASISIDETTNTLLLQFMTFGNTGANASANGNIQRNADQLTYHDGTSTRNVLFDTKSQTVTNKSLVDASTLFVDDSDNTKAMQFQCSSISTSTIRTLTVQNVSGTIYVTGGTDVAVADGGTNLSSYAIGDLLYASGSTTLSRLAIGSSTNILIVSGGLPAWASAATVGGTINLNDLADVNVTGAATGDFLQLQSGTWADFDLFDTANTWSQLQTFTLGGTFNGTTTIADTINLRFGSANQRITGTNASVLLELVANNSINAGEIRLDPRVTLDFRINTASEATLVANKLTFNNGATDTYLGWATSGQLDFGVDATNEMSLTANRLSFDGSYLDWTTANKLDISVTTDLDIIVGANGDKLTFETFDFGGGTTYPLLSPVSSAAAGSQNIMMQKGGIYLVEGNVTPSLYFANTTFSEYCYLGYTPATNQITLNGDGVNETTFIISRQTEMRFALYGRSNVTAGNRRGGEIRWYHGTSGSNTVRGYMFVNDANQLVFDSSAQSTNTDTGNAWIDFDDGSASFSTMSVTGLGTSGRIIYTGSSGLLTISSNLTFASNVLTVTGSAAITSNLSVGGVLLDGTSQNALELVDTGSANYFRLYNAGAGNPVTLASHGSDTNVGMSFITRGIGQYLFQTVTSSTILTLTAATLGVNWITLTQGLTGSPPTISTGSITDVKVPLELTTQGGGDVRVLQSTVGNEVFRLYSTATADDPTESVYQNRVTTTDATVTTIHTFTVPSSTTYMIEATVVARRTGGSAGVAEDGAGYRLLATYKNSAGTATLIGAVSTVHTAESQAGWDCAFSPTGATVRLRVTGATNNNVTWHMTARVWAVGS